MKVVTCYQAAKLAQVSKQLISSNKTANALCKGKYPYFKFDPGSGKFGVDIHDPSWKEWIEKRQSMGLMKTDEEIKSLTNTKSQLNQATLDKYEVPKTLIKAIVDAIKETIDIDKKELSKLLNLIDKKFKESDK